jgi:hypothetical protein
MMEFKSAFFSILIVGMVITASGIILSEWASVYDSGISSDLEGDLVKTSSLANISETQKGRINPQSGEASSDYEAETFRGGYGILTNIYSSIRLVYGDDGMIDSVAERFGIPTYVWQTIVIMIIFSITFTLIAIIFRRARSTT